MTNKLLLFSFRVILSTIFVFTLSACSSDNTKEYSQESAQQVFNNLKGTYQGPVLIDNIPQTVAITIGNDFSVKRLPLSPILKKIFTDENQLKEALSSTNDITFTAKIQNIQITTLNALLTMETTDFIFKVKVGGKDYQVNSLIKSEVYQINDNTISVNIEVKELSCEGMVYDLTKNPITYNIDLASRLDNYN